MRQPKELTGIQRLIVFKHYLNPNSWLCVEETDTELVVKYKFSDTVKTLKKDVNLWENR